VQNESELFDFFLLRLDLRSDYEKAAYIQNIISLIKESTYDLFYCKIIATKAVPEAAERLQALHELGFVASEKILVDQDGIKYDDYYILEDK